MNLNYFTKTLEYGYNAPKKHTSFVEVQNKLEKDGYKVHSEMIQNYFHWYFSIYSNFDINQHRAGRRDQLQFKVDDIKNHGVYITPDGYMMYQRMLEQDQASQDSKDAVKIAVDSRCVAWYAMIVGIAIGLVQIFIAIIFKN